MPPVLNTPGLGKSQGCKYVRVKQGAEYTWISLKNASLCMNMLEYASIYLNKQFWIFQILNVSDIVHSIRSLYKLLRSHQDRHDSEHCQTIKMDHFAKRIMPECSCATRKFSGQGKFCGTRTLQYIFCSKCKKTKAPQGNMLEFFLLDTLKITFWIENLTLNRASFPKSKHFFWFSKMDKGGLP